MVSPVNNVTSTILRPTQTAAASTSAQRQAAAAFKPLTTAKPAAADSNTITLASAKATPDTNLPRGSIVDKLV